MKRLLVIILGIVVLGLFNQCEYINIPIGVNPLEWAEDQVNLADANNTFGIGLLQELNTTQTNENIFISPFSVATALSMAANGAQGATQTQMNEVMAFNGFDMQAINEMYLSTINRITTLDEQVNMAMANAIWYDPSRLAINSDFANTITNYYNGEANGIAFQDPIAPSLINNWVSDATNGTIPTVLEGIPDYAIMYLINAIYFKGNWQTPFDSLFTYSGDFNLTDGSTTTIDLMNAQTNIPYYNHEMFQAIDLAYGDSLFMMTVFVPNDGHSVHDIVSNLSLENYKNWLNALQNTQIMLQLPKFSIEYDQQLPTQLIAMGMDIPFAANANVFPNFSNFGTPLTGNDMHITGVLHKTFIEVDEVGTEASAVTVVEVGVTSVPNYPVVAANKPFFFVIRERQANLILFAGKMMNPNE